MGARPEARLVDDAQHRGTRHYVVEMRCGAGIVADRIVDVVRTDHDPEVRVVLGLLSAVYGGAGVKHSRVEVAATARLTVADDNVRRSGVTGCSRLHNDR